MSNVLHVNDVCPSGNAPGYQQLDGQAYHCVLLHDFPDRRERLAATALQGLLAATAHPAVRVKPGTSWDQQAAFMSALAVRFADYLIAELDRSRA